MDTSSPNTSSAPERWFAAVGQTPPGKPLRLLGQPEDGFESVGEVMRWLESRSLIRLVHIPVWEEPWWKGWGDPYCAVLGSRNDPWDGAVRESVPEKPAPQTDELTPEEWDAVLYTLDLPAISAFHRTPEPSGRRWYSRLPRSFEPKATNDCER